MTRFCQRPWHLVGECPSVLHKIIWLFDVDRSFYKVLYFFCCRAPFQDCPSFLCMQFQSCHVQELQTRDDLNRCWKFHLVFWTTVDPTVAAEVASKITNGSFRVFCFLAARDGSMGEDWPPSEAFPWTSQTALESKVSPDAMEPKTKVSFQQIQNAFFKKDSRVLPKSNTFLKLIFLDFFRWVLWQLLKAIYPGQAFSGDTPENTVGAASMAAGRRLQKHRADWL